MSLAGCCVAAAPAGAAYIIYTSAGVTLLSGTCSDDDGPTTAVATSASAAAACPGGASEVSADIATASVGLFVAADSTPTVTALSSAEVEFLDVVRFEVPLALSGQAIEIEVACVLEGTMTLDAAAFMGGVLLQSRCALADSAGANLFDGLFVDMSPVSGVRVRSGSVTITPPDYAMNVALRMRAPGLSEGFLDFRDSFEIRFSTPPGVTYTSDSGVFQAPEPSGAAAGAVGFAFLWARRRLVS